MADTCVTNIGSRLELFVEDSLISELRGSARLLLHKPVIRDENYPTDMPWEGRNCGYVTVLKHEHTYFMYYQGWDINVESSVNDEAHGALRICCALSSDGIHWNRPDLQIFPFNGNLHNNIVWIGEDEECKGAHGFAPFIDTNPNCPPDQKFKAIGSVMSGTPALYAMKSADGLHWSLMQKQPILQGQAYDSQNLIFWDSMRGHYRIYLRDFSQSGFEGTRGIKTATSKDFLNWPEPEWLQYVDSPEEELYTNQVQPYYRAPHLFLGFPSRYVEREWSPTIDMLIDPDNRNKRRVLAERYGMATSDGLFMASRDGQLFKRWDEAFLRPGLRTHGSWTYGDAYQCCGLLETASTITDAPNELTFYAVENYWRNPSSRFRRYTIRIDGFVSVNAPLGGGEIITAPIIYSGSELHLNVSTSAGGSIKAALMDTSGAYLPGFSPEDCYEILGDSLDYTVQWKPESCLKKHAGQPVMVQFLLRDADLFSYRFA